MKLNKKKVIALALAVCLIATLSMGTLAWFTDDDSVTNDFLIAGSEGDADDVFSIDVWEEDKNGTRYDGEDGIDYPSILPGDVLVKNVNVENTGSYEQYARVTVTVTQAHIWQEIFGEIYVPLNLIATDLNTADFTGWSAEWDADTDELIYVLYYNDVLAVDQIVNLFKTVAIPSALDRYQAAEMNGGFQISVKAEAVQTKNVGDSAPEAFSTVGMYIEPGEYSNANTGKGLLAALTAGVDITLENDIDMSGVAWTPVATYNGTFDGADYTISNLTISGDDAAMFADASGATIKNFKLDNVQVEGEYVAAVAYYAENATFENIEILSGAIDAEAYGAGIAFEAYDITIKNCVNNANVTAGYSASGIGAWVYTSTVEGCENNGTIIGANRAGGICANFSGTMTGCTNNGDVTSNGKGAAGGIAGILGGASNFENCTNNGNVTTTVDDVNASAAGIVGQLPSKKVAITACTNNGNITAEQSHAAGIGFSLYGGITAEGCTNTGVISGADGQADIVAAKGAFGGANTIK